MQGWLGQQHPIHTNELAHRQPCHLRQAIQAGHRDHLQCAWQGTINAEDRYFSNKYYKQVILGDAFFGSDKALKDSNATYAIVKQLAADNDLFYKKFTAAMQKLTWLGVDPSVKRLGL